MTYLAAVCAALSLSSLFQGLLTRAVGLAFTGAGLIGAVLLQEIVR